MSLLRTKALVAIASVLIGASACGGASPGIGTCAQAMSHVASCLQIPLASGGDADIDRGCSVAAQGQASQVLNMSCAEIQASVTDPSGQPDPCMWSEGQALLDCVAPSMPTAPVGEWQNSYFASESYEGQLCTICTEDPCARRCKPGDHCVDTSSGICGLQAALGQ